MEVIMSTVLLIMQIISCVALIAIITMQNGNEGGLGALAGNSDNYFGKNKGKTAEAKLVLFTKIAGSLFFVLALVASLLVLFGA